MKVHDVMTASPISCTETDTARAVAQMMRDHDVGSLPVVAAGDSKQLAGMVTDRDLCCGLLADGRGPESLIREYISRDPVTCKANDKLEDCEKLMQRHQVRRVPVVDANNTCIGIVSQADLALKDKDTNVKKTVAAISKPSHGQRVA
jgi:CBS domain-containing protein